MEVVCICERHTARYSAPDILIICQVTASLLETAQGTRPTVCKTMVHSSNISHLCEEAFNIDDWGTLASIVHKIQRYTQDDRSQECREQYCRRLGKLGDNTV